MFFRKVNQPDELRDLHNDFPLGGKKIKIIKIVLPKHQLQILKDNNFSLSKN